MNFEPKNTKAVFSEPLTLEAVTTHILDVPIKRVHRFAALEITQQAYLIISLHLKNGMTGFGEAVVPGGPWWSGDSMESMAATINTYFKPILVGADLRDYPRLRQQMDRSVFGQTFAKAGVEAAVLDLWGKALSVPVSTLLGGRVHDRIETVWPLASGDVEQDIAEAKDLMDKRLFRRFKVKMGAVSPREDVHHIEELAAALGPEAKLIIDLNNMWDLPKAKQLLPPLIEAGIAVIEQPIERWNVNGMVQLTSQLSVPVMADESVSTAQDALRLAEHGAANIFALKPMKHGGLFGTRQIAAIAEAAGIACFGGTFLESSLGTAAALNTYATLPGLTYGCENIGPFWLADDIVKDPLVFEDFHVTVPCGAGLGSEPDLEKLRDYARS